MKPQSALVRTQCGVELHTIAAVDLDLILVVFPHDAELNDAFGDRGNFEGGLVLWVLLKEGGIFKGGDEFC